MSETIFDHDRLDVYRLAIQYTAESFGAAKRLSGLHRHARDQWLRAAQSIPLNIAEGNGKHSWKDRARFLDVARGSAFEAQSEYRADVDYEQEHRYAEHEHEGSQDKTMPASGRLRRK